MSDADRRRDEAEALSAIFPDVFAEVSSGEWTFIHKDDAALHAKLTCYLPDDYPSCTPPVLVLDIPRCSSNSASKTHETCEQFLRSFEPNEEFGLILAEQFFEFCNGLENRDSHDGRAVSSRATAVNGNRANEFDVNTPEASAEQEAEQDAEQGEEADVAVLVKLGSDVASGIAASLRASGAAGFQEPASGLFVHGELGIVVEICEAVAGEPVDSEIVNAEDLGVTGTGTTELHFSIDGLDTEEVSSWATEWVAKSQREGEVQTAQFANDLLRWADAQRAAGEGKYGSADGVGDNSFGDGATTGSSASAGSMTLTGNAAWKARLQAGEVVAFRGGGNSLHPRIKSGECCKYSPVFKHEDVKEKDIVFCQIKGRYWGHMVKKKTFVGGKDEYEYTISNIHGWENGTIPLTNIYGKVIDHWK